MTEGPETPPLPAGKPSAKVMKLRLAAIREALAEPADAEERD